MPNTCSTCKHWHPIDNTSLRIAADIVGQCKGAPPCGDFKWPKTTASSFCSMHSDTQGAQVAFATARADGRREGELLLSGLRVGATAKEVLATQQAFFEAGARDAGSTAEGASPPPSAPPSTATAPRPASTTLPRRAKR